MGSHRVGHDWSDLAAVVVLPVCSSTSHSVCSCFFFFGSLPVPILLTRTACHLTPRLDFIRKHSSSSPVQVFPQAPRSCLKTMTPLQQWTATPSSWFSLQVLGLLCFLIPSWGEGMDRKRFPKTAESAAHRPYKLVICLYPQVHPLPSPAGSTLGGEQMMQFFCCLQRTVWAPSLFRRH